MTNLYKWEKYFTEVLRDLQNNYVQQRKLYFYVIKGSSWLSGSEGEQRAKSPLMVKIKKTITVALHSWAFMSGHNHWESCPCSAFTRIQNHNKHGQLQWVYQALFWWQLVLETIKASHGGFASEPRTSVVHNKQTSQNAWHIQMVMTISSFTCPQSGGRAWNSTLF